MRSHSAEAGVAGTLKKNARLVLPLTNTMQVLAPWSPHHRLTGPEAPHSQPLPSTHSLRPTDCLDADISGAGNMQLLSRWDPVAMAMCHGDNHLRQSILIKP